MSWVIALLGVALAVAPFVLGYSDQTTAMWLSIGLGVLVALVAGYKALVRDIGHWEDWLAVLAGLVAIIAPFIFFDAVPTVGVWTSVIIGALVVIIAGYMALMTPSAR